MARKNTIKSDNPGSIHFDPRTKSVMAETSHLQDNIKEKVNAVREVMPGRSNNEIILVLQYYDYNVEKAIQAYVEDGAKQALNEWHYPGNKAPKKKRNKKKKTANDSIPQVNGDVTPAEEVPNGVVINGSVESDTEPSKTNCSEVSSSVSSLSMSPTTPSVPSPTQPYSVKPSDTSQNVTSGSLTAPSSVKPQTAPSTASNRQKSLSPLTKGSTSSRNKSKSPLPNGKQTQASNVKPQTPTKSQSSVTVSIESSSSSLPTSSSSQPQRPHHPHSRQQHHSGSHSHRQRTASERSNDGHSGPKQIHKTLEKSVKDLHRQTVSLERLKLVLNEEVDKNYKRIKSVFDEMRACLNNREVQLIQEMDQVKAVANETFIMRQKNAVDLKRDIDRSERMDDKQIAQLRADIKHFVSDRKIDEDLSRTTRFLYDSDYLRREISQFGEVVPVKCTYSLRRPSVSSVTSNEEPTNSNVVVPNSAVVSVSQSEVSKDNHAHGLDSKETEEMAELQQRLKNSLHVQGFDKGSPRPQTHPSKENMQDSRRQDQRPHSSGLRPQSAGGPRPQSGRGYGYRGRGGGGGYRGRGQGRQWSPRKDNSQGGRGRNFARGDNQHVNSSQ